MTYEEIRVALMGHLAAFDGIEQECIDYPNRAIPFEPPSEGVWCRATIQHGPAFMAGMGEKPYTRKPGRLVIQCFDRVGAGLGPLNRLIDALEAHFAYWSQGALECLEVSQVDVGISDSVGRPQGLGFYQCNVIIRFRAG